MRVREETARFQNTIHGRICDRAVSPAIKVVTRGSRDDRLDRSYCIRTDRGRPPSKAARTAWP